MRYTIAIFLTVIFSFSAFFNASAQSSESIWLTTNVTEYKTREIFKVQINAVSVTSIQGFTFQIRYDPACLKPVNASSPIPGMNGLSLPQTPGLVDASFASTVPQSINGILAEVTFQTLGGCRTNLLLESAALAVRNASGFAAPLPGVTLGQNNVSLNIDSAVGISQDQSLSGTPLPLDPGTFTSDSSTPVFAIAFLTIILVAGLGYVIYKAIEKMGPPAQGSSFLSHSAVVQFRDGSLAGKNFVLNKLPFIIGHDPANDVCINDPFVLDWHVKIYSSNSGYYLMDLGGETFVNGHQVKKTSAILQSGDVVRLGKKTSFVFGS